MKKILLTSFVLANFLIISSVFAYSYTQPCTKTGSCSCNSGWCINDESCISSNCGYECPAPKLNSKLTSNDCTPGNNNNCECIEVLDRPICSGSTCSCTVSGICQYTCNNGYEWDGNACVLSVSNTPPQHANSGTNTTKTGSSCKFYEKWYDLKGNLSSYIFSTNNTGSWVNDTSSTFAQVNNSWVNVTKTLNSTNNLLIGWKIYAKDTNNAWSVSSHTLTTIEADVKKPLWKNQGQSNSTADPRKEIKLYAQGYDEIGLDYAWLKTNETGSWEVYDTINMQDATAWKWSNFTWSGIGNGVVAWKIYYNDTSGNENATNIMTFNVIDVAPETPMLNSPSNGAVNQPLTVKLNITVKDENGDSLDVTFYDDENKTICSKKDQENGIVICEWKNLLASTTYGWYVNVTDGTYSVKSYTWEFLTSESGTTTTTSSTTTTTTLPAETIPTVPSTTKPEGKSKTPLIIGGVIAVVIGAVIAIVFFTSVSRPSL